jgi:triacylglycerol lipase
VPAWASWGMSLLNGLVGDYLHRRQNGLAIEMAFYHQGRQLPLTRDSLLRSHSDAAPKICILVHGLGCNEGIWTFADPAQPDLDTSYGALLQADLGYTPLYLRYNTGLPIAENGRRLAALLDELLACYPARSNEIVLIGHSMGGLVLRSACHYGRVRRSAWIDLVTRVFYLGTPHEGAQFEQLGHVATMVLHAMPNPITKMIGDIFNLRSQGVKDLRLGTLHDAGDRVGLDREAPGSPAVIPWLANARHYLIAGTLTANPRHPVSVLFGDGLVAMPRVNEPAAPGSSLPPVPGENVKLLPGIHHLRLTRDLDVYQQIRQWCQSE